MNKIKELEELEELVSRFFKIEGEHDWCSERYFSTEDEDYFSVMEDCWIEMGKISKEVSKWIDNKEANYFLSYEMNYITKLMA